MTGSLFASIGSRSRRCRRRHRRLRRRYQPPSSSDPAVATAVFLHPPQGPVYITYGSGHIQTVLHRCAPSWAHGVEIYKQWNAITALMDDRPAEHSHFVIESLVSRKCLAMFWLYVECNLVIRFVHQHLLLTGPIGKVRSRGFGIPLRSSIHIITKSFY